MTLTVTILGSSGSYATVDNPCSGYLIRSQSATVLLDCGPGTLGPLQEHINLADLSAVVTTHCHPDHWLELPVLRNIFCYFMPRPALPVYGTAETDAMHRALTVSARPEVFEWTTINDQSTFTVGDQHWSFTRSDHPVETLAPLVDVDGRRFCFTSDTGPGWSFSGIDPTVDLALVDASHLKEYEGQGIPHMSARQAGERARAGGVKRLVLTHLVPGSDLAAHRAEAELAYGGPVEVAVPGMTFALDPTH
jgi:ribonuclease BN (tRNA processing enzyme)